jgi:hypothetical protein
MTAFRAEGLGRRRGIRINADISKRLSDVH